MGGLLFLTIDNVVLLIYKTKYVEAPKLFKVEHYDLTEPFLKKL